MLRALLVLIGLAATTNSPAPPAAPASDTAPALKEISPGVFDYNGIHLDKKNHRITFPGVVNQRQGLVEYLLVNDKGKVHESLLSTKMVPHDIHVALLLIGLKDPTKENSRETTPPSAIDAAYLQSAPKLEGPSVKISVTSTRDGKPVETPAGNWILNLKTNRPMTNVPWTYNGSMIQDGVFLADQELSIVAVVTDPTALVNNPREGYDDDQIWQAQEKSIPPLDTPVEITITIADPTTP